MVYCETWRERRIAGMATVKKPSGTACDTYKPAISENLPRAGEGWLTPT